MNPPSKMCEEIQFLGLLRRNFKENFRVYLTNFPIILSKVIFLLFHLTKGFIIVSYGS